MLKINPALRLTLYKIKNSRNDRGIDNVIKLYD